MFTNLGYTTGTYDLLHEGHFEILKKCKLYCRKLVVGLVSDELGVKQKRKPVLTYTHRKQLLENCKYVDGVVEFNGTSKQEDYNKLKFEILFIADEYYKKEEYSSFEIDFPKIPVIYIPRTNHISTSEIYKKIIASILEDINVKASGISGDVLSLEWKKNKNFIIKPIKVSDKEHFNTSNNYYLPIPPPRNWKMLTTNKPENTYPMISGINPMREIYIYDLLKDKEWYPVIKIEEKNNIERDYIINEQTMISTMLKERHLGKLYWLIQNDGGKTLLDYVKDKSEEKRLDIYRKIIKIINEMRRIELLHMDLHAENILVDEDEKISIIDFGWCLHKSFDMEEKELSYYNKCFYDNFDTLHFMESLVYMGIEKTIPKLN